MKTSNKVNMTKERKIASNDPLTTARIMELIKLYQAEKSNLHEFMHSTYLSKQRALKIARTLKQELSENALTVFEVNASNKLEVKVLPSQSRAVIDVEDIVPEDYVSLQTQRYFDMQKIEEDLKQGKQIPGVHLESIDALDINVTPINNVSYL